MKHPHGFTLIELMIALVIMGILAMLAIGYFGDSVIKANRTEARSALTTAAGSLEKCRSLYGAYNSASCNVAFPIVTDSNYYSISAALNSATFALTATPVAGETQSKDADCTTLMLTNTGIKNATGADSANCW